MILKVKELSVASRLKLHASADLLTEVFVTNMPHRSNMLLILFFFLQGHVWVELWLHSQPFNDSVNILQRGRDFVGRQASDLDFQNIQISEGHPDRALQGMVIFSDAANPVLRSNRGDNVGAGYEILSNEFPVSLERVVNFFHCVLPWSVILRSSKF